MPNERVLIFKLDVESEDFKEISYSGDLPLYKFLNHYRILLFVDPEHSRIYIWEGNEVTTRMKFLSAQLAPKIRDQYGIDYRITTVDDGDETLDFKGLILKDFVEEDGEKEVNNNQSNSYDSISHCLIFIRQIKHKYNILLRIKQGFIYAK